MSDMNNNDWNQDFSGFEFEDFGDTPKTPKKPLPNLNRPNLNQGNQPEMNQQPKKSKKAKKEKAPKPPKKQKAPKEPMKSGAKTAIIITGVVVVLALAIVAGCLIFISTREHGNNLEEYNKLMASTTNVGESESVESNETLAAQPKPEENAEDCSNVEYIVKSFSAEELSNYNLEYTFQNNIIVKDGYVEPWQPEAWAGTDKYSTVESNQMTAGVFKFKSKTNPFETITVEIVNKPGEKFNFGELDKVYTVYVEIESATGNTEIHRIEASEFLNKIIGSNELTMKTIMGEGFDESNALDLKTGDSVIKELTLDNGEAMKVTYTRIDPEKSAQVAEETPEDREARLRAEWVESFRLFRESNPNMSDDDIVVLMKSVYGVETLNEYLDENIETRMFYGQNKVLIEFHSNRDLTNAFDIATSAYLAIEEYEAMNETRWLSTEYGLNNFDGTPAWFQKLDGLVKKDDTKRANYSVTNRTSMGSESDNKIVSSVASASFIESVSDTSYDVILTESNEGTIVEMHMTSHNDNIESLTDSVSSVIETVFYSVNTTVKDQLSRALNESGALVNKHINADLNIKLDDIATGDLNIESNENGGVSWKLYIKYTVPDSN